MPESLSRKKKVRGGHQSSTKRTISTLYETLEITEDTESIVTNPEGKTGDLKGQLKWKIHV